LAACLAAVAGGPRTISAADGVAARGPATVSFVESFRRDEASPFVTAIGLRRVGPVEPTASARVVVLVDTSASQLGDYRLRDAVEGLLEASRPRDTVLLAAADVSCVPLSPGFAPPADASHAAAIEKLSARTPLGSTDLIEIIDRGIELFGDQPALAGSARAIVYVGDGPGLGGVDPVEFQRVLEALRSRHIVFSGIGIGPQVNWPCLAAVASATGGMLMVPGDDVAARDAGARMAELAVTAVAWPEEVAISSAGPAVGLGMLPIRMPPLRADRDSVVLVLGPLESASIEMQLDTGAAAIVDPPLSLALPDQECKEENAYLEELARNAFGTAGAFLPLLGREGLDLARASIRGEAATLAALSRQAEASGAHDAAVRLAQAALRRDPDNQAAAVIRSVAVAGSIPA
jgi:hypothetical protein